MSKKLKYIHQKNISQTLFFETKRWTDDDNTEHKDIAIYGIANKEQFAECVNCKNKFWIDDVRGYESLTDCVFCGLPINVSSDELNNIIEHLNKSDYYEFDKKDEL